jgi:hypothetical protein
LLAPALFQHAPEGIVAWDVVRRLYPKTVPAARRATPHIIERKTGDFDPAYLEDRYRTPHVPRHMP